MFTSMEWKKPHTCAIDSSENRYIYQKGPYAHEGSFIITAP